LISDENIYLLGNEKEMTRNTIFIIFFYLFINIKKEMKKKQKDYGTKRGKSKKTKKKREETVTDSNTFHGKKRTWVSANRLDKKRIMMKKKK
jgi:hypothetical protein